MTILQVGFPKSGNLWLYKIIQNILTHSGIAPRSFIQDHPINPLTKTWHLSYPEQADIDMLDINFNACFYRISSIFRMPLHDLDDYLARTHHVWTHSPYRGANSDAVLGQFVHIVYIVRDPRDALVSAAHFAMTPYMRTYYPHVFHSVEHYLAHQLDETITLWRQHVADYRAHEDRFGIHFVRFEDLRQDFAHTLCQLMTALGQGWNTDMLTRIEAAVTFKRMKRQNPAHVRRGRAGGWQDHLTVDQQARIVALAGDLMHELGYLTNTVCGESED